MSIVVLEDHGYDMIFNKGKTFMRHIAMRDVKNIEVCVKNLYKLDVEYFVGLRTREEEV